jgi:DNA-binding response OmpR family regulator
LKKKFLIVEDERSLRELYKLTFAAFFPEHEIVAVGTFSEAMEYTLANLSDIAFVLLDGQLDGMQPSYPIAVAMREAGYTGFIILLSGRSPEEVMPVKVIKSTTFNRFYGKPIDLRLFAEEWRPKLPL